MSSEPKRHPMRPDAFAAITRRLAPPGDFRCVRGPGTGNGYSCVKCKGFAYDMVRYNCSHLACFECAKTTAADSEKPVCDACQNPVVDFECPSQTVADVLGSLAFVCKAPECVDYPRMSKHFYSVHHERCHGPLADRYGRACTHCSQIYRDSPDGKRSHSQQCAGSASKQLDCIWKALVKNSLVLADTPLMSGTFVVQDKSDDQLTVALMQWFNPRKDKLVGPSESQLKWDRDRVKYTANCSAHEEYETNWTKLLLSDYQVIRDPAPSSIVVTEAKHVSGMRVCTCACA